MIDLTNPIFHDENKAREYLEENRWPDGPACPHCGSMEDWTRLEGQKHRKGLYQCNGCRKQFSVTVGTVFERSKVPLHKWVLATHLMCASKKGYSAHQLHRTLGVTYKTAWFMSHRIREAMRETHTPQDFGGEGETVEVDETFWGNKKPRGQKKGRGFHHKEKVLTLVERGGRARSFHVPAVNAKTLSPILKEQIKRETGIMTDEAKVYETVGQHFASHDYVSHGIGEYVRGGVHTNNIESYFSVFKRGLVGTYQHVSPKHLKRYAGEFDFRYNRRAALGIDDAERARQALQGADGKRLTYGRPEARA